MKRGILIITVLLSLVFVMSLWVVSAVPCSPPGIYDSTYFCNVTGETEELKEDYTECLNNYECLHGSCVYGKKTACTITQGTTRSGINCILPGEGVPGIDDDLLCNALPGGCIWNYTGEDCEIGKCTDWNKSQISCIDALNCSWSIDAVESHYCEPEYKEIAAQTNFLQNFWIRIVLFFQGIFEREAPTTAAEAGLGIPLPPIELQSFYNDSTNIIHLNWSHPSVGTDWHPFALTLPLLSNIFPSVSAITGQAIGSEGITGYTSQETITLYRCLGKTAFCEHRAWCDHWGENICKKENGQCVPRSTCYQHPGTIYKSTCQGEGGKCQWKTAEVAPKEVLVVFERTKTKSCVLDEANRLEVCDMGAHTSHIGLQCDSTQADNYCKAIGYEGVVYNSIQCDGRGHGEYFRIDAATGVETHHKSVDDGWVLAMKCKLKTTGCTNDDDCDDISDVDDNCRDVYNPDRLDEDGDCPSPPYSTDPKCGDACDATPIGPLVCTGGELDCTKISYINCPTDLNCYKREDCTGEIDIEDFCSALDSMLRPSGWGDCEKWDRFKDGDCDWGSDDVAGTSGYPPREFDLCAEASDEACVWRQGSFGYDGCYPYPSTNAPDKDEVNCNDIYIEGFINLDYDGCGGCNCNIWYDCQKEYSCIQSPYKEPHDCLNIGDGYRCREYDGDAGCEWKKVVPCDGTWTLGEQCDGGDNCIPAGETNECTCPSDYVPDGAGGCVIGVTNFTNYTVYRSPISAVFYIRGGMLIENSSYEKIAEIEITDSAYCDSDGCEFNDTNWIEGGRSYYYIVTSVTADGIESAVSDEISVPLPACTGVSVVADTVCRSYGDEVSCEGDTGCRWDGGDTTAPSIGFVSPTPNKMELEDSGLDQNYIEANVSVEDDFGIDTLTISLSGPPGINHIFRSVTSTLLTPSTSFFNYTKFTGLSNGIYVLHANVSDLAGNINETKTRRIIISLIDQENPSIEFIEPTTETETTTYEGSIMAKVNATDDRGIKLITIYLYNSTGFREEPVTPAQSPVEYIYSKEFTGLLPDTYFLNASVTDLAGKISITETRNITVKEIPEGEAYPIVEFISTPPEGEYFPDSDDLVVEINITDNLGDISWTLSSNVSGHIDGGTTTFSEVHENISLTGLLVSVNSIDVHKITLEATDRVPLPSSASFVITIKNENCTDTKDNDGDGIFDSLDRDCDITEGGVALTIIDLLAPPSAFTHRKINVNCKYETDSQDTKSIGACIKLTLDGSGIACEDKIVDTDSNTTKFRDCDVGGQAGTDAKIKCFVSDNCNRETPAENTSLINITKFSICKYKDAGEENIILSLIEPEEDDTFDPEDENEINIEILVTNENTAGEALPIIVEAWLYDIDEENKLANVTSEVITIDYPVEHKFNLTMTVPNIEFSENNRLYYKAYVEDEERHVCESDSILLVLQEADCEDDDEDGYCEENDCDDGDEDINLGINESLYCTDGIDNDCDDLIDEDDSDCVIPSGQIIEILTGKSNDAGALTTRGARRIMHPASILDFKIAGVSHSALVKIISSNSVTLTISSNPINISLITGQTKDVDIDRDGTEDLMITFNGIVSGAADITFRSIYTAPPGDGNGDGDGDGDDDEGGIGIGWIIFIFVLIIGIAVVVALIFLRKKREAGPKPAGVGMRRPFTSSRPPPRPPPRQAPIRRPAPMRPVGPPRRLR